MKVLARSPRRSTLSVLAVVAAVVALAQTAAGAHTALNLTGTWKGVGGADGTYEITQSGASLTWYGHADDGHTWANDFTGSIKGDEIVGTFQDRRGFDVYQHGSVTVHIDNACHLSFVSASVGWGTQTWTKTNCTAADLLVPIESVSNGCGGAGWDSLVHAQNYLGNTSKYADSNINPLARTYTVNFVDACNLHDAGYSGAVVKDKLNGGRIVDFRTWSRKQVDEKFLADMRWLCTRQIPATARTALKNCKARGGNASFGAESRYNFVRRWGYLFFDADPNEPGTQRTGPRAND